MKIEKLTPDFLRARPVLKKLQTAGYEAYFVGGSVRDLLLGRPSHDVDIATSAYPAEIKTVFPRTIDVGIEHGTVLVLAGKTEAEQYEVTTFRTESAYTDFRRPDSVAFVRDLSEDLKRRDFTINALAMTADGEIIDQFDGLTDLENKRLRAVGNPAERFQEDALRTLRALRFAATLDFEIEPATFDAIKSHASLLPNISIERSFIEMDKLLLAPFWKKGLSAANDSVVWQYLPDFQKVDVNDLSADFQFKNSAQAWGWLTLQFGGKLDLRQWKVSNELIKAVCQLTEAYQLTEWSPTSLYKYGLEVAQLTDDLKAAEGQQSQADKILSLDAQLQIHDKSEIVVRGAELMAEGFPAGPALGKMLSEIEQKIVRNKLKNEKRDILTYVRENFF